MSIVDWYKKWKAERPIRRQRELCRTGYHNWTDRPEGRIQCVSPGCGRYLR